MFFSNLRNYFLTLQIIPESGEFFILYTNPFPFSTTFPNPLIDFPPSGSKETLTACYHLFGKFFKIQERSRESFLSASFLCFMRVFCNYASNLSLFYFYIGFTQIISSKLPKRVELCIFQYLSR